MQRPTLLHASFFVSAAVVLVLQTGCPPEEFQGRVRTEEPVQTVPLLYSTTILTLWDFCSCPPPDVTPPGSAQTVCLLPGGQQPKPVIGYELSVPKGSGGTAIVGPCSMVLTFMLEPDYTGHIPSRTGLLMCDFTHTATVGDASHYVIAITVRLRGEVETIEEREFIFSAIPNLGMDQVPYSAGSELVQFEHTFLSGEFYQVEIEVSGTLLAPTYAPTDGGEITFSFEVDNLSIDFRFHPL